MNAVITSDVPGTSLVPASLGEAVRFAEVMAQGRLVPKHLQGSPGDCLMVIEQAARWRMSPFAVAQATSVISGKMMFEGKLVAAAVETSGAIVGHLDYTFDGEGDARSITVFATRRGETQPRSVTVTLKDARTPNEMWKRQPDQQLVYHGARVWARRWTPAVILGVYSREEMGPIIDVEPESEPEQPALKAAAASMPPTERIVDPTVYATQPGTKRTRGSFLDALEIALRDAKSAEEVDRIVCGEEVMRAKEVFTNGHKTRLDRLISDALNKWWTEPSDEALGEVEIAGAEKAGA
jgi:hypothetical protein